MVEYGLKYPWIVCALPPISNTLVWSSILHTNCCNFVTFLLTYHIVFTEPFLYVYITLCTWLYITLRVIYNTKLIRLETSDNLRHRSYPLGNIHFTIHRYPNNGKPFKGKINEKLQKMNTKYGKTKYRKRKKGETVYNQNRGDDGAKSKIFIACVPHVSSCINSSLTLSICSSLFVSNPVGYKIRCGDTIRFSLQFWTPIMIG